MTLIPLFSHAYNVIAMRCVALHCVAMKLLYNTIMSSIFNYPSDVIPFAQSLSISLYILNFYFFENILKKKITSSHLRLRLPNSIYNRASCSYFYTFPLIFSSLLGVLYLYKMFWCSPLLYRIAVCLLIAFGFRCTVRTCTTHCV